MHSLHACVVRLLQWLQREKRELAPPGGCPPEGQKERKRIKKGAAARMGYASDTGARVSSPLILGRFQFFKNPVALILPPEARAGPVRGLPRLQTPKQSAASYVKVSGAAGAGCSSAGAPPWSPLPPGGRGPTKPAYGRRCPLNGRWGSNWRPWHRPLGGAGAAAARWPQPQRRRSASRGRRSGPPLPW